MSTCTKDIIKSDERTREKQIYISDSFDSDLNITLNIDESANSMNHSVADENSNVIKLKNITARRRWKILARAIVKEKSYANINKQLASTEIVSNDILKKSLCDGLNSDAEINLASVRSFDSFDLIKHDHVDPSNSYFNYKITNNSADREFFYNVNIHQIKNREWTARDLIGFNNTGTYYIILMVCYNLCQLYHSFYFG